MSRLAFTKGVSLNHDTSNNANPNVTTNINISNSTPIPSEVSVSTRDIKTISEDGTVSTFDLDQINEIEFLKCIIRLYMEQKITYEGKEIICTNEQLSNILSKLTGGTVEIETSEIDVDCGCFKGKNIPLRNIDKIWITTNEERTIFKYSYPQYLTLFDEYQISLKYLKD